MPVHARCAPTATIGGASGGFQLASPPVPSPAGGGFQLNATSSEQLVVLTAQRCRALQEVQAAAGVLQAALWRLSALGEGAQGGDEGDPPLPPPVARLLSVEDVLAGGALVLRMAPHPLRLVTVAGPAALRPRAAPPAASSSPLAAAAAVPELELIEI